MDYNIKLIQDQKQSFSPKLIPALNILQMGYYDLEKMIETTLIDNPFSEIDFDNASTMGIEENEADYKIVKKSNSDDSQEFEIGEDNEEDLVTYVMMQLANEIKNNKEKQIIEYILASLDTKGYLKEGIQDICNLLDLSEEEATHYLQLIQNVEPFGLGAKTLSECLLIQLQHLDRPTELAEIIVISYLPYVGEHLYDKIANKENVSIDEVMKAVETIKLLNPLPANGFAIKERTNFIVPDVYIDEDNSKLTLELNSNYEQKLKMNMDNLEIYKNGNLDKNSKEFLSKKLKDFNWLLYSTSRRSITLNKIIALLVDFQKDFLLTGDKKKLKPLRLSDLEEMSNLHSSTISRALQDKYFHCKFGTFPLKMLVPRVYAKNGEVSVSKNQIKDEIREIILNEDKTKPLSDQKIQEYLAEEGYTLSRRSVTLYREEMNIAKSKFRKES